MQPKGCLKVVFLVCFKGCSVILCVAYLVTGLNFFAVVFCLPVYLVVLVSAWLSFGDSKFLSALGDVDVYPLESA